MKKTAILSFVFLSLFFSTSIAQDMKVKDDKIKIKDKGDGKMKIKDKSNGAMTAMSTGNYKAMYSSDFQIGNPAYVQKIMTVWQDWDDNMLDRNDFFADTLAMYFSDGSMMKGKAENFAFAKKYRSGFTSVKTDLHAVVPLRSNDRNEDVVAVWGMETNTLPDGKVEKKNLHEVWFFNKDGMISEMRQWTGEVK